MDDTKLMGLPIGIGIVIGIVIGAVIGGSLAIGVGITIGMIVGAAIGALLRASSKPQYSRDRTPVESRRTDVTDLNRSPVHRLALMSVSDRSIVLS